MDISFFQILLSVGIWCHTKIFLKALNKIAFAGKAATVGDLGNGTVGMAEQKLGGAGQAEVGAKAVEGLSRNLVKVSVDLGNADVKDRGDLLGGQGLVKMTYQVLHNVKNITV